MFYVKIFYQYNYGQRSIDTACHHRIFGQSLCLVYCVITYHLLGKLWYITCYF